MGMLVTWVLDDKNNFEQDSLHKGFFGQEVKEKDMCPVTVS